MLLYAVTIFLSAFLLFQVQPLIAKIILPWFGGSAAVWSAAMLFFQISLLAGYAYAHWLTRKSARMQMNVHAVLLVASCALLPILPNPYWKPTAVGDPTLRILVLLAVTIGLPYFLLSSTSPLLQAWYVRRTGSKVPYRLFALSNFGSMLALVSFPFLVEPTLSSRHQAYTWSGAYALFALLCAGAAWASKEETYPAAAVANAALANADPMEAVPVVTPAVAVADHPAEDKRPSIGELVLWVALAACASTLLVASTNHLSQNVAPIPLLWVLPLALYLLTFILAFESDRVYKRWVFMPWLAPALAWMAYSIYAEDGNLNIKYLIPIYAAGLFVCCMMCHGELALRRPAPKYLTMFYLMVSLGGAIGGVFVALIAPNLFRSYLELPIALVACAILAAIVLWDQSVPKLGSWPVRVALAIAVGVLAGWLARKQIGEYRGYKLVARNFYGVLHVRDDDPSETYPERTLLHGTINHGSQLLKEDQRYLMTSYYAEGSGVGRAMRALQDRGPVRYGSVGLGAGVMTNYGRAGDYLRVYEINPLVQNISTPAQGALFTFYPHSAADKAVVMGDARLSLERQEPQQYDLLSVDAFSSDAIPIHLLTREALGLYFHHLKPTGVLALHISNRYLNLEPVCSAGADYYKKYAMTVSDDAGDAPYLSSSTWVLLAADASLFDAPAFSSADMHRAVTPKGFRPWTDDYSNIVQILSLK
ncbi:MAG TPA: fused MFS/spermidine synthase [Bryobacteraceae bacterium]|nr:fused MFS/spermidine synthase [Bryobacteraceae bacterium]